MADKSEAKRSHKSPSRLIEVDAWIDSSIFRLWHGFSRFWETVTIQSRRLRARGFTRVVSEIVGEGFTLGVAGVILLLVLAQPAMEMTAEGLPEEADFSVTFLDRKGNEIGQRGILRAAAVPIDELPDQFIKAVLATEDRRFFEHWGIDFFGLARAMGENARAGGVVQGGSTLTQQLAKNVFLTPEQSLERKINEAFLSVWLESNLTKREILSMYLDRAYMGGGTFGAAAAAEFYFDKSIRDVNLAESAMLAGLFKAPAKYAPHINLPAARARANEVLTNIVQADFMTEGQVVASRRQPAEAVDRSQRQSPDYFLDFAFEEAQRLVRENKLGTRNLVARTTIDLKLQALADETIDYHMRQFGKSYDVEEAAMAVLSDDGGVRAMVGGRDYGKSQFNRAANALRQPGSSFKVYVYATAMEQGMQPDDTIVDSPLRIGNWAPQNYGRSFAGRVTLQNALARSLNIPAVRLYQKVGFDNTVKLAQEMGIESELRGDKTMALGTSEVTVLDQATAYTTFANGGNTPRRHAITQLYDAEGRILWDVRRDLPERRMILSEQATKNMNDMLVGVTEQGTARRAQLSMTRAAGKTGTTQDYRDGWFVGFTGNYVAAVWYGNDSFRPTKRVSGGTLPAMTWQRFMEAAHQNIELKPIPYIEDPFPDGKRDVAEPTDNPLIASGQTGLTVDAEEVLTKISERFEALKPMTNDRVASASGGATPVAAATTTSQSVEN
ncbi:Glycosyl transferase, family 51:Penicillin-binding protein, transpeptidase domain [Fulvimarina pelagi HTCC2506]|uniref:Glycosyl transferase, family 51:Penicillin-binding protein, transpeptidase domain n=1 Tax=Fulvimarina pelagi HTCC2506 TaxID=314231 RepID=Q0FYV1_9HYPH|nr:PBP1A family penicillin-binding protein [Fulvimarina pelagi]EAU40207.1 Glycosyl transferase, family 51:Penicillin-binding protein, transpeptidase domain [Fulvimarina pelagi HTCC2506]